MYQVIYPVSAIFLAHSKPSNNVHFSSKIPTVCHLVVIEFTGAKTFPNVTAFSGWVWYQNPLILLVWPLSSLYTGCSVWNLRPNCLCLSRNKAIHSLCSLSSKKNPLSYWFWKLVFSQEKMICFPAMNAFYTNFFYSSVGFLLHLVPGLNLSHFECPMLIGSTFLEIVQQWETSQSLPFF